MTEVERLLDLAHTYDMKAQYYRRQAGEALIVSNQHVKNDILDQRTTRLLVDLATGRKSP